MTLDEWQRGGRSFRHRGHQIFYRREGSGPPLLCIHGFPTASWDWHPIWHELTASADVAAADMIGFGFSAKPPRYEYSIHDQADLQEELLRQLGWEEVDILAHDYGDTVAQELLARQEERLRERGGKPQPRLRSICFLNGGLFPEQHRARRIQRLLLGPLGPLLGRLTTRKSFGQGFAAVFGPNTQPSAAELDDFYRLMTFNHGHRIGHRLIRYIPERRQFRERWVGALQQTKVPLRFINGPEDPVSGRHMAERYRELVPNADVVLLEGIGHYPQVEDPAGVIGAWREWMAPRNRNEPGDLGSV